jgi:hypothetical protein
VPADRLALGSGAAGVELTEGVRSDPVGSTLGTVLKGLTGVHARAVHETVPSRKTLRVTCNSAQ